MVSHIQETTPHPTLTAHQSQQQNHTNQNPSFSHPLTPLTTLHTSQRRDTISEGLNLDARGNARLVQWHLHPLNTSSRGIASPAQHHYTGKEPGTTSAKHVTQVAYSLNVHAATLYGTQVACTQHPFSPFRRQDAIVCGEQCWDELTTSAPTREMHTTKRRFLLHKHDTNNTTHSFPLVTCIGQQHTLAVTTVDATESKEQPAVQAQQLSGSTEART